MDVRALPVLRLHSTLHVAALLLLPIGSNQYPELFLTEPDPDQALEKGVWVSPGAYRGDRLHRGACLWGSWVGLLAQRGSSGDSLQRARVRGPGSVAHVTESGPPETATRS